MTLYLVTGGARSGKSRFAEQLAERLAGYGGEAAESAAIGRRLVYVATMQALDEETSERIRRHRERRASAWETVEEPYRPESIVGNVCTQQGSSAVLLVDCVTLWLSNLLLDEEGRDRWALPEVQDELAERAEHLARVAAASSCPVILVTNEVGDSLVPEYPLGRVFRDLAGRVNQILAQHAEEVYLTVCGIPVSLRALSAWPDMPGR